MIYPSDILEYQLMLLPQCNNYMIYFIRYSQSFVIIWFLLQLPELAGLLMLTFSVYLLDVCKKEALSSADAEQTSATLTLYCQPPLPRDPSLQPLHQHLILLQPSLPLISVPLRLSQPEVLLPLRLCLDQTSPGTVISV